MYNMSASVWTAASFPNTLITFILSIHFIGLCTWVYCLYSETCYSVHLRAWRLSPVRLHNTQKTPSGCQSVQVSHVPCWRSVVCLLSVLVCRSLLSGVKNSSGEAQICRNWWVISVKSLVLTLFWNDDLMEMMLSEKNTATVESCAANLCACVLQSQLTCGFKPSSSQPATDEVQI